MKTFPLLFIINFFEIGVIRYECRRFVMESQIPTWTDYFRQHLAGDSSDDEDSQDLGMFCICLLSAVCIHSPHSTDKNFLPDPKINNIVGLFHGDSK